MWNITTKITLKAIGNFKFLSLSKSITVGVKLKHLKYMCKLFSQTETEDPWQGHSIRMWFLQQLYRPGLKYTLTRSLALTLSLTSSLLFRTWQQAVNGKKQRRVLFYFGSVSIHEYAHSGIHVGQQGTER